jgi:flavin-binding protein dodecin
MPAQSRSRDLTLSRLSPCANHYAGASVAPRECDRQTIACDLRPREWLSVMVEKTIDLTGISANSVEDAVQLAISRAGVTIKGIHTAHVQNIDAIVEANKVVRWKVNVKVTFQVKDELHE